MDYLAHIKMGDFDGSSAALLRSAAILQLGPNATLADARIAYESAKHACEVDSQLSPQECQARMALIKQAFDHFYDYATTMANRGDETTGVFERNQSKRILDLSMEHMWLLRQGRVMRPQVEAMKAAQQGLQTRQRYTGGGLEGGRDRFTSKIRRVEAKSRSHSIFEDWMRKNQNYTVLWMLGGLSASAVLLLGVVVGLILRSSPHDVSQERPNYPTVATQVVVQDEVEAFTPSVVQQSIQGIERYLSRCTQSLAGAIAPSSNHEVQFVLELTISPAGNLLNVGIDSGGKFPNDLSQCIKNALLSYFRLSVAPGEHTMLKVPIVVALSQTEEP